MKLDQVLRVATHGGASDVILKVGSHPRFRHQGQLITLSDGVSITNEIMAQWSKELVPARLLNELERTGDIDFSYQSDFGARFRVNLFKQQQRTSIVMRVLSNHIKTLEELQLPKVIQEFTKIKRGLILVTGATGSGKTTTLAGMIQKINIDRACHIVTIEDPVEYLFTDINSTINQREVGLDVESFASALRAALRQTPDVILVGELRDKDTTETALMAAETGHLVLSTLHTVDAVDSLTRLMSYFPAHQHATIRNQLSHTLQAVISQRLVRRLDNKGMAPAMEIMKVNALIRETIVKEQSFEMIADAIAKGGEAYNMQTFDQSLFQLYNRGIISKETALLHASSKETMQLMMSGIG